LAPRLILLLVLQTVLQQISKNLSFLCVPLSPICAFQLRNTSAEAISEFNAQGSMYVA
jgi:hypothetical protein